ncbi:MAG TPA: uracil-DNA glycosylase [Gammaproteobacteria bacterium]|nr:MAG: uracil-DNA glycosylase [Gammaproteobacteria bacterium TMED163]HAR91324.1 uracil-DNA glycosylase [Gammaproteobacteria bacterium]|tara:strand:+ start:90 stop:809 length:720 start_codon:yes stop_codon:yes gene_type:complete
MTTTEAASANRAIKLKASWRQKLDDQFQADYMQALRQFLLAEKAFGKHIFPPGDEIFSALNATDFDAVKVVILGQDPYHGPGQAHGLCFSVKPGVQVPPSLKNIYKELQADVDFQVPSHGCLQYWAQQGVLLLNAVLTVQGGQAASHQGKGWERFTDAIVGLLNKEREGLIFMLWGSYAQKKGAIVDRDRHLVLQSPHPSPLSASRGFFGNHHFSRANSYLESKGKRAIDWQLPMQVSA